MNLPTNESESDLMSFQLVTIFCFDMIRDLREKLFEVE